MGIKTGMKKERLRGNQDWNEEREVALMKKERLRGNQDWNEEREVAWEPGLE